MSVALVTQHVMRLRRIILPSVACPAVWQPTLSNTDQAHHKISVNHYE